MRVTLHIQGDENMKNATLLAMVLFLAITARADIIYLNEGEVISGVVTRMDSVSVEMTLSDGQVRSFRVEQIFQATDDAGHIIFPKARPAMVPDLQPSPGLSSTNPESSRLQTALTSGYRRVYHLPFWPVLGGTALLGYVGISQLSQSSDSYKESVDRENAGLEFNALRSQSLKQRTWGQIAIAGAVACLVVGLTPKIEKVPLHQALKLKPTRNGITLCFNL
jgi:hypothetical protein